MSQQAHCRACGTQFPAPDVSFCPKCGIGGPHDGSLPYPEPAAPNNTQLIYAHPPPGQSLAIASLVVGIASTFICGFGFILGIAGIVLGIIAQKHLKNAGAYTGPATAGIVLSIVGTVLNILFILFYVGMLFSFVLMDYWGH